MTVIRKILAACLVATCLAGAAILVTGGPARFAPEFARVAPEPEASTSWFGALIAVAWADDDDDDDDDGFIGAAPLAKAGFDRTVAVGAAVVLDGAGSVSPSGALLSHAWSFAAKPAGSLALLDDPAAVKPRFVADLAGDYRLELTVADGAGGSAPDSVTVSTANVPPHADAGPDRRIALADLVVLDGAASSDFDGDALGYAWSLVEKPVGSAAALSDPAALRPSFFADLSGTYVAELVVTEAGGGAGSAPSQVTLSTGNLAPKPDAGPDISTAVGATLRFDPDGTSDADADRLQARWFLIARPPASLAALVTPEGSRPRVTLDGPGVYVVQLKASDEAAIAFDSVTIVTTTGAGATGNSAPVADAGPDQAIAAGAAVTLDGAGSSDVDGDMLSYRWALIAVPAGSNALLDDPAAVRPSFEADLAGDYVAQLIVDDGTEPARADTVLLSSGNLAPVADAGPDQTVTGETALLDGSGSSDANGDPLAFRWAALSMVGDDDDDDDLGSSLSDPAAVAPTLTLAGDDDDDSGAGLTLVQLFVADGATESAADTLLVSMANSRPVADAGAEQPRVARGVPVQLDGAASNDADSDPLTFQWALVAKPAGSTAALAGATTATPSFTPDLAGLYVAQLVVADAQLASRPDSVAVQANARPIADAGADQEVMLGDQVGLDGAASSDPDGDPLTFAWTIATAPAGSLATLAGAATATPSFTPDIAGDYVVDLTVNDGFEDSAPDSVTVTVTGVNERPVAEAGPEQGILVGALVALDGGASFDPEARPLTYAWRFTSAPAGSTATLANLQAPSFTAALAGLYIAELTVNDGNRDSIADTVGIRAGTGVVNGAPTLDPVGDRTVALGSTLSLTLTGGDPDGDTVSFFAIDLPANAGLDGATGAFSFTPDGSQATGFTVTFGVTDGLASDSESVLLTVTPAPAGGIATVVGRVLDAQDFALGVETPVVGATVCLLINSFFCGGGVDATDAQGNFTLSGVSGGRRVLEVNGIPIAAPGATHYTRLREEIRILSAVTNNLPQPLLMPRVDLGSLTTVSATLDTTVSNAALATSLVVQAGAAIRGSGVAYTGNLTLSDYPRAQALSFLPATVFPCQLYSVQAEDAIFVGFTPPAAITMPNVDSLAAGSAVDFWFLDPVSGRFSITGTGQVDATGTQIVTLTGGVPAVGAVAAVPPAPLVALAADTNPGNFTPTALADGNLSTRVTLPTTRSLGVERGLSFVYNALAAAAEPIVAVETTIPANGAVPPVLEGSLQVDGVAVTGTVFTTTADPTPLAPGESVRQAFQFDAAGLATGSYPTRFLVTADYGCSRIGAEAEGRVLVNQQNASPFGAGWTLAQLQALTVQDDGRLILTEGDGTALTFTPFDTVDTTEDLVQLAEAPRTVVVNAFENDLETRIFGEQPSLTLPADLAVTLPVPKQYDANGDLVIGTLPAGAIVDSHFLHFDPEGTFNSILSTGRMTFQNDIVGLILLDAGLDASDALLGDPDTLYPDPAVVTVPGETSNLRGLELVATRDSFEILDDLRTIQVDLQTDVAADQIRVLTAPAAVVLASSDFEGGGEGWSLDLNSAQPVHVATGGNPGGHLQAIDDTLNQPFRWRAPAKFLGDRSLAYNGRLSYDLRLPSSLLPGDFADEVTLEGAGLVLAFNTAYRPAAGPSAPWTRYSVLLNEGAGWVLQGSATVPSQAQFQAVLADLQGLTVLGEFQGGLGEAGLIDNVALTGAPLPGRIASPPGDFSTVVRNDDGTFTRTMKDGTAFLFDADGKLASETDRNANVTTYAYNADGTLASVSDPADPTRVISLAYAAGQIASVTDTANRITRFQLDTAANLVSATNSDDSVRRYTYDTNNRLIEEASERGFVTTQSYGFAGQYTGSGFPDGASITASISKSLGLADLGIGIGSEANPAPYAVPNGTAELVDAKGNPFTMRFNAFGSVVEVTDPINRTTTLTRDANNLVTATVAPSDGEIPTSPSTTLAGVSSLSVATASSTTGVVTTELEYDERGNVTVRREAVGTLLERQTTFEYEPVFNNAIRITDPAGFATTFEYDAKGNLTKTTDALLGEQISTFDPTTGLALSRQDANGNLTDLAYDLFGNLQTITDAGLNQTRFQRDTAGRVAARTEGFGTPDQRTTSFTYDAMNRVETETDGTGAVTTTRYDAAGNVVESEDATGVVVVRVYEERSQLALEDDPAQGPVTRTYDANGNLETLATALPGQTVTWVYDAVNRVEKTTDPLGGDRLFGYDAQDNLISVTDARQAGLPNGVPTTFGFDLLERRIRRTNQLGETWAFEFDSRDNMTRAVDANGQAIDRVYDVLSRLTTVTLVESDGATVEDTITFTYDANGNPLTVKDGDSSLAFTFDALNRVETAATLADPGTVQPPALLSSVYDAVGDRTQLNHGPNELVVDGSWNFTHDATGRLIDLVSPTGDPTNPIMLGYDAAGRLTRIDFPNQVVSELLYDLGGRPNRIGHKRGLAELTSFAYGYDAESKITSITEPAGTRKLFYDASQQLVSGGFLGAPETYSYDEEGNRLTSHLSATHTHDAANRLLADGSFTYTYDANGNLETKTEIATNATTSYTWDVQNRLVRIDFPNSTFAGYRYDADGRRIEKNMNGTLVRYVYDGDDIVLEYDGTNALQARYSHGLEVDQPLAQERGGQSFFYHTDHLGSVRKLTNAGGTVVSSYDTDSFGRFEVRSEGVVNPFTFTAREFDVENGLYFYRSRYYDPEIGRFMNEDPKGFGSADLNLYRYVYNSPVNVTDPTGEGLILDALVRCLVGAQSSVAAGFIGERIATVFEVIAKQLSNAVLENFIGDRPFVDPPPITTEEVVDAALGRAGAGCAAGLASVPAGVAFGTGSAPPIILVFLGTAAAGAGSGIVQAVTR